MRFDDLGREIYSACIKIADSDDGLIAMKFLEFSNGKVVSIELRPPTKRDMSYYKASLITDNALKKASKNA